MRYIAPVIISFFLTSCYIANNGENIEFSALLAPSAEETLTQECIIEPISFIDPTGVSIKDRFLLPDGFSRIESETGSFAEFLQELPLKPEGTTARYFDGNEKTDDVYLAVVDYSLGDRDLQQCADSVIRLKAEYLYACGRTEDIHFNFVNGFKADFTKWATGYGISVNEKNASWVKDDRNNDSYESFHRYLNMVYGYACTISLEDELIPKDVSEMSIGDVFIKGGSPGHCVIIVDIAVNEESGEKIFMLAQGFMPAQDIQILKGDEENSPWYSADISGQLIVPDWVFDMSQLKTWQD